jgi:hypothetical protein
MLSPNIDDSIDESDLPDEVEASIENVRWVLDNHSCRTFVWGKTKKEKKASRVLVDAMTANVAIVVYDNLSEKNQEKAAKMIATSNATAIKFFDICWKLIQKHGN